MFESIEPFVIVSSRMTKDKKWIWSRSDHRMANGLAGAIARTLTADGFGHAMISVLDVGNGNTERGSAEWWFKTYGGGDKT